MDEIGKIIVSVIWIVGLCHDGWVEGYMVGDNPHHRVEKLDQRGSFVLEWRVDWVESQVTFNVTVETRGYVGLGLSAAGKTRGADIVIGGVMPSGRPYFSDGHAIANQMPEEDSSQDWKLHEARETRTHTFLRFSRAFDTCDPQDYPITEDRIAVIWAFGEKDDPEEYHHRNRGVFDLHLLQPDYTPRITRDFRTGAPLSVGDGKVKNVKVWTIPTEMVMPSADTTYWCTIHRTPADLQRKHHIIGVEARFPSEESRQYVHHLVILKCNVPRGLNRNPHAMFGSYVGHPGQSCLIPSIPSGGPMPTEYCTERVDGWVIGSRAVFHPPHVGMPLQPNEYYMVQVHYDNPYRISGKRVAVNVDYFYTSTVREFESSIMIVEASFPGWPPSLLIPPSSPDHTIYGMCSAECTETMLPPEGITIFMGNLHSHNAGSRMKLQHFRKGRELPWILADDNYSNQFQQIRVINREVKILPGDQIVMTCVYDNTKGNGTTVGGFSPRQEMCAAFTWIYNRLPEYSVCSSTQDSTPDRQRLLAGVGNVTWEESLLEFTVDQPPPLAGLTISQVSDNYVHWNLKRRADLQEFHRRHPQQALCTPELFSREPGAPPGENKPLVRFPVKVPPYQPPKSCSFTQ